MSLNTNLTGAPYYDDFDTAKNFHRILFKPGVAIQAREMTQLQSILQNQVERFGNNILQEGTIIEGCNFTEIANLKYVKILDLNTNGQPVPMSNYAGAKINGLSTGVTAIVQDYDIGLESQDPDLNTLYIKYTGSGNTDPSIKTFNVSENLELRYLSNNGLIDTVTVAGSVLSIPANAVGDSYGVRVGEGIIYQKGFFTRVDPQLVIVPSYTTASGVTTANRYTNVPNNAVVGFQTAESLITSDNDISLLDNASGYNNYQAPGADRLKLTPILTVMDKTTAENDQTFFAIQEYMYGKVVRRNLGTQYNGIMNVIEQRTKEESGNYIVKDFPIKTSNNIVTTEVTGIKVGKSYAITNLGSTGTSGFVAIGAPSGATVGTIFTATALGVGDGEVREQALNLDIGSGIAYVEGKRVELLNRTTVDLPKSTSSNTELTQSVSSNYGNYVLVKEYMGAFDFNKAATVNLFNATQTNSTDGSIGANSGVSIGTAKVISVEYDSGTMSSANAYYKMYLSDIKMNISNTTITGASSNGTSFIYVASNNNYTANTKVSITGVNPTTYNLSNQTVTTANATHFTIANTSTGGSYVNNGIATVIGIWDDVKSIVNGIAGTADLVDTTIYDQAFKLRLFTVGRDALKALPAATTSANYIYRSSNVISSIVNTGVASTFTVPTGTFNVSGTLDSTQRKDFMLISGTTTGPYVKDKPIDLSTATMVVTSNQLNITIPAFANSTPIANSVLYYNAKRTAITAPTKKVLETVYVKILCANNSANNTGPWTLGFPDVYKIENIYVGSANSYAAESSANDKKSYFSLNTNQKDDYYGLSTISKKSGLTLTQYSTLLVKLTRFKKSTIDTDYGFFTVSSYPIDDVNTANTSAIQTYNIPSYTATNNMVYDLRDVIDFRMYSVNTAANSTTSASATVNPVSTISFNTNSELYLPTANEPLVTDYSYYLARKDYLMIDASGNLVLKQGTPSDSPIPPNEPSSGMILADITVPEYPSLSSSAAASLNKKRYGVTVTPRSHRRYTMDDVGGIDSRVNRLEYYSALSLLETDTKNLMITDANGLNRFKNGILVDNFSNLMGADLFDPDFSAGYDADTEEVIPRFREYPLHIKKDIGINDNNIRYYNNSFTIKDTNNRILIRQPYATYHKETVVNTYDNTGTIQIYPYYDLGKDTIITPEPSGLGDPIYEYSADGLSVKTSTLTYKNGGWYNWGYHSGKWQWVSSTVSTSTFNSAFARPQDIRIKVTGLKPKTRYWVFVDGQATNVLPGHYTSGTDITSISSGYGTRDTSEAIHGDWIHDTSALWSESGEMSVLSDSKGEMLAVLNIPPNNLKVGEHKIQVYESAKLGTTTVATAIYSAYNDGDAHGFAKGREYPMPPITFKTGGTYTETSVINVNDTLVFDYLSQTFTIKRTMGNDSVIVTDTIDLYFQAKPAASTGHGVTIQIVGTKNDRPNPSEILASKYVPNESINANTTSEAATTISFDDLIILKTDTTYAIVIIPDAHDPSFRMWIARSGDKDVIKQISVTKDTFTGTLFTSTNGLAWTPNNTDNLKFTFYNNEYSGTGVSYLTNDDHEFFTITPTGTTYIDNKGHTYGSNFTADEIVVKLNANISLASITTNSSLKTISTNTDLTGTFSSGNWLGYWAVGANNNIVVDAVKITAANSTVITLDRAPFYSNTSANVFKAVTGTVSYYNASSNLLHLRGSSNPIGASVASTQKFVVGDTIRGIKSNCSATISSIDALNVSTMRAKVDQYNYTNTSTKYQLDFIAGPSPSFIRNDTNQPISVTQEIPYHKYLGTIPSASLQTQQGFRISATLNNNFSGVKDSTPIVNYKSGIINVFEHIINNDSNNEILPIGGNALTKFITKPVTLEENLDAEDLKVYLTAYRPTGAKIEVYARFKHKSDQRPLGEVEWTKLTLKDSTNLTSSVSDLYDYREFEYYMPVGAVLGANAGAILDSSNGNKITYKDAGGAIYIGYKYFAIKIVLLGEAHNVVPKVKNLRAIALT